MGAGTAVFVCGWCFAPRGRIRSLAFVVDGEDQPVLDHGMPRIDVLRALDSPRSYRSGFWGIARIGAGDGEGESELLLRARLDDGSEAEAGLARVSTAPRAEQPARVPAPEPSTGPLVAISMATFEPAMHLFERQVDSIRAQTHRNWVCVISDDCSAPERFAQIERTLAGDPRFFVSRSPRRLRFYHNFERALCAGPGRGRLRGDGRSGRLLASRQARDPAGVRSETRNSSTATLGSSDPTVS